MSQDSSSQGQLTRVLAGKDVLALAFGAMIGWGWIVLTGSWIQSADIRGFTLAPSAASPRLLQLTVSREVVEAFLAAVAEWPVQALEYKSMPRFRVAKVLDDLCGNTLQPVLVNTLTHAKTLRNPRQV